MEVLLAILVLILIVLAAVAIVMGVRSRNSKTSGSESPAPQDPFHTGDQDSLRGDPRTLTAADIVEIRGASYTVRGTLRLSEGSWSWSEHLLDDAKGNRLWLAVEEDPELTLSVWTPIDEQAEQLHPGAKRIEFGSRTYHFEESGSARFRSEATTGLDEHGEVHYHDYEAAGGALLSFEAYGEADWEASTGEELTRYDVRIYPASA